MKEGNFDQPNLCEHGNLKETCNICAAEKVNIENVAEANNTIQSNEINAVSEESKIEAANQVNSDDELEGGGVEYAPEGWMNAAQLAESVGVAPRTIRAMVMQYRDHEEWFKFLRHEKRGHTLQYFAPELIKKIQETIENRQATPDGWMTNLGVAESTGRSFTVPQKIADRYRESNPEWFRKYFGPTNIYAEYYAPELIKIIDEELGSREVAPPGWMNLKELSRNLGRSRDFVINFDDEQREAHPDWVKKYSTPRGMYVEHYSPNFIAAITQVAEARESAPDGWLTSLSLARIVNSNYQTVQRVADRYRESNPEWFHMYDNVTGTSVEHYAPELVLEIKKMYESRELAPNGWKTRSMLGEELVVSDTRINSIVDKYRATNPEWFQRYVDSINRLAEYLSPELVALVNAEIESTPENPPEGWMTNNKVANLLSQTYIRVQKIATQYRVAHPERFHIYKDSGGRAQEHFSPELIEKIRETVQVEEAPAGWMTNFATARLLSVQQKFPEKVVDQYRDEHPEWFGQYYEPKMGGLTEFYSPELIDKIRQEAEGRAAAQAPELWKPNKAVANDLDVNPTTLRNLAEKFRVSNPEWFREFLNKAGGKSDHYSPELVAVLKEEFDKRIERPFGWKTENEVSDNLNTSHLVVRRIANAYRSDNSLWFQFYKDRSGKFSEHYAPELIDRIKAELQDRKPAPERWLTTSATAENVDASFSGVKTVAESFRNSHPEWFVHYLTSGGLYTEHYAPELVENIAQIIGSRERAPINWLTHSSVAKSVGAAQETIRNIAEEYREDHPEWFKRHASINAEEYEYYHPQLVQLIKEKLTVRREGIPANWMLHSDLANEARMGYGHLRTIVEPYRLTNPDWFRTARSVKGKDVECYSPELIQVVKDRSAAYEDAPPGWMFKRKLEEVLDISYNLIRRISDPYRISNPGWFNIYRTPAGKIVEHLSPELVEKIKNEVQALPRASEKWMTNGALSEELDYAFLTVSRVADKYRDKHPEWFKELRGVSGRPGEHYSPELIAFIKNELDNRGRSFEKEAEGFLQKVATEGTPESQQFREIVSIFGASRSVDILYRMHPSFRGVPVDRVRGMLADYLGDFLLVRPDLDINDLGKLDGLAEYLSDEDLRQGFLQVVKDNGLTFYQDQRKHGSKKDPREIASEYFEQLKVKVAGLENPAILEVIGQAEAYYTSLYEDIQIPDQMVEQLRAGREFPDVNQRINIKEIEYKKKVLIADEMGLGKSASAILSKEHLGVQCALIVTPSNVISTWQHYLSDETDPSGKQIGYFKPGQAPRVLTVKSPEDLEGVETDSYDYVLLSQERLDARYMKELQALQYDMLIVDEMHKLKNVKTGVRSQNIVDLAKRIEGDDQYLVALSGTPVPNKVADVALTLKMLYPEKFVAVKNADLVRRIIHGDIIDVRNLLVPRMQLKRLQESLDMPPLTETRVSVELSKEEEEIYSVLYEEDELSPSEKIAAMRMFLLNPDLLELTPGMESSKIKALDKEIASAFERHTSTVVFVNSFVEGVIRGDHPIMDRLSIPEGVEVRVIEGDVPQPERQEIQRDLQQKKKKMLVFVNGQTADVGVDFSGADQVIMYNGPWTAYDKDQQVGRVYREGHTEPLEVKTLIVENTIEDGIHRYVAAKKKAVEKLLRGIPQTEMEKQLLEQDEKVPLDREVSPELAQYYFSAWDRMMKIFTYVREMGEAKFKSFLDRHGEEYANCYTELGSRTYQANNARVTSSIMAEMIREKGIDAAELRILDIASGPEMLRRHLPEDLQDSVVSIDINRHHFDDEPGMKVVGSFTALPVKDGSMDYANLALALHYTRLIPSQQEYERLQVLTEMNRVLKPGGRGTISMIFNIELKDEDKTRKVMQELGFEIVEEYTGEAVSGNNYRSHIFTLEKTGDIPEMQEKRDINTLAERIGADTLDGLKLKKDKVSKIKDSRKIITDTTLSTSIGTRKVDIQFNARDQKVFDEEQAVLKEGRALKSLYQRLENIPEAELKRLGYARFVAAKRYALLKKLKEGEGAVVIR